jgi:hypothetical protein
MEKQFPPDSVTHRSGQWSTFAGSKNAYILIEPVRKNVLAYWQEYTLCERKAGDDIITDRFECIWQCGHEPPEIDSSDHFRIFRDCRGRYFLVSLSIPAITGQSFC